LRYPEEQELLQSRRSQKKKWEASNKEIGEQRSRKLTGNKMTDGKKGQTPKMVHDDCRNDEGKLYGTSNQGGKKKK